MEHQLLAMKWVLSEKERVFDHIDLISTIDPG
jgi:hypothetical protein